MSNFDKENNNNNNNDKKIVLPPPPKATKSNGDSSSNNNGNSNGSNLKLKRVHTISGGSISTTTMTTIGGGNITTTTTNDGDVVAGSGDGDGGGGGGSSSSSSSGGCGRNIQQQQQHQEIYSININPIESCSSATDSIMTAAAAATTTTTATSIDGLQQPQQQQQQSSTMINNANNVDVDNRSTITTTTTPPPPLQPTTMKLNQDSMEDDDGDGGLQMEAPKARCDDGHDKMIGKDRQEEGTETKTAKEKEKEKEEEEVVYFDDDDEEDCDDNDLWTMTSEQQKYYIKQFDLLQKNSSGNIQGQVAKVFFEKSGLESKELSCIWKMSDMDEDGQLSLAEFCIAMHLVVLRRNKVELPETLPTQLKNYHVNWSATLNGGSGSSGGGSMMIGQSSLMDQNNSVDMLDLDVDDETEQVNSEIAYHHLQSQNERNSQPNWTRFNDSPDALLLIKDEIECRSSSSESGSPIKLANFDYDINYIANNPNIKHPVPLRISPLSPALSSMEQINIDDITNAAEKCSIHSCSSIDSFETIDYVNKPQPFFPVSQTTSDEILKQSLLMNTQEPNDCDFFEKIINHVKTIEHRFYRMNPIKGNLLPTTIQHENVSDSDKIEELKMIIQTIDSNRRILLQQNYQLYQDVGGLLKIVNYLFEKSEKNSPQPNSSANVAEKSDAKI